MAKCECGRRKSHWSSVCRHCHHKLQLKAVQRYIESESRGTCPTHTSHLLVYNNSLPGDLWLQCLYPYTTAGAAIAATYTPAGGTKCHYQVLCSRDLYQGTKEAINV
jgi:hypothetical protein